MKRKPRYYYIYDKELKRKVTCVKINKEYVSLVDSRVLAEEGEEECIK